MNWVHEHHRRGIATITALLFLALTCSLAVAFFSTTNMELRKSENLRQVTDARLAAESGLAFATRQLKGVLVESAGAPNMAGAAYYHLSATLDGTPNLGGQSVSLDGETVSVPRIAIDGEKGFSFTVTRIADDEMRLVVTGLSGTCARRVAVTWGTVVDTTVLSYAVASRSRVIITDGAVVDGDICSTWDRTQISSYEVPPFMTESDTQVIGDLKTTLSEAEYDEYNSGNYVDGEYEDMVYDEPEFAQYTTEDFDTSSYKAGLANITALGGPDYTDGDSWFPSSSNKRRKLSRPVYQNRTFENVYIPVGHNPKFINCTFNKVFYVDTNESKTLDDWDHYYYGEHAIPGREYKSDDRYNDQSNNVVFEDCTFNGPVVTAVPRDYWWSKNALTFEGTTTFTNTHMPESTILAPNFGVDIGGRGYDEESNPNSKLTGIIVGGIVDIRGTANIEGTILSMYYPDTDRGTAARYYGTNIGFYADGGETGGATGFPGNIRIVPQPDNVLPYGMTGKYTLAPNPDSYCELPTGD